MKKITKCNRHIMTKKLNYIVQKFVSGAKSEKTSSFNALEYHNSRLSSGGAVVLRVAHLDDVERVPVDVHGMREAPPRPQVQQDDLVHHVPGQGQDVGTFARDVIHCA